MSNKFSYFELFSRKHRPQFLPTFIVPKPQNFFATTPVVGVKAVIAHYNERKQFATLNYRRIYVLTWWRTRPWSNITIRRTALPHQELEQINNNKWHTHSGSCWIYEQWSCAAVISNQYHCMASCCCCKINLWLIRSGLQEQSCASGTVQGIFVFLFLRWHDSWNVNLIDWIRLN